MCRNKLVSSYYTNCRSRNATSQAGVTSGPEDCPLVGAGASGYLDVHAARLLRHAAAVISADVSAGGRNRASVDLRYLPCPSLPYLVTLLEMNLHCFHATRLCTWFLANSSSVRACVRACMHACVWVGGGGAAPWLSRSLTRLFTARSEDASFSRISSVCPEARIHSDIARAHETIHSLLRPHSVSD